MKRISFLFRLVSVLILLFFSVSNCLKFSGNRLRNHYMNISSMQAEKIISQMTLNTVSTLLSSDYAEVDFIKKDDTYLINSNSMNAILKDAVNLLYEQIKMLENGSLYDNDLFYELSFSLLFDNPLIPSLGPKIPVKISLLGDIKGCIDVDIEEFGINNAIINLILDINMSLKVVLPLIQEAKSLSVSTILFSELFKGEVPYLNVNEYIYYSGESL